MTHTGFSSFYRLAMVMALGLGLGFSTLSCNSGSSGPTAPEAGSGEGTLAINMIDEPTDEVCELWVYIQDLRVKPDGQPPVLLGNEIGVWDLLSLVQGVEAPLGTWGVDPGVYQFIEILLDESRSYVIERNLDDPGTDDAPNCFDDIQTPLQTPSKKFKVNGGPFNVSSVTRVTIDFDAKKSLKRKGSPNNPKGWQLKPKVSIVEVEEK